MRGTRSATVEPKLVKATVAVAPIASLLSFGDAAIPCQTCQRRLPTRPPQKCYLRVPARLYSVGLA